MVRRKVIDKDELQRGRILSNAEVKRLLDNARLSQDKALILTMFENGMSLSGTRTLKYEDVTESLKK